MSEVRLQLWLAKSGVASRRRAEAMIAAGEVEVNGKIVRVQGTKVDPVRDKVTVRSQPVQAEAPAYVLMNKPKGYVTTAKDPDGRETIFDLLPPQDVRLYTVGRLDFNTEGALLLTNDGELAHALMHPSRGVRKVYHAKMQGEVSKEQIRQLQRGVDLPPPANWEEESHGAVYKPERSAPADVALVSDTGKHTWLEIGIHEGKNRQIHRMAAAVGTSVRKLIRVAYGTLTIEGLEVGKHRRLTDAEVAALRQTAGLSKRPATLGPMAERRPAPAEERPARRGDRGSETSRNTRGEAASGRAREGAPPRPRRRDEEPQHGARRRSDAPTPNRRSDGPRPARYADEAPRTPRSRADGPPRPSRFSDEAPRSPRSRADGPPRPSRFSDEAPRSPRSRGAHGQGDEPRRGRTSSERPPGARSGADRPSPAWSAADRPAPPRREGRSKAPGGRSPERPRVRTETPREERPAARGARRRPPTRR